MIRIGIGGLDLRALAGQLLSRRAGAEARAQYAGRRLTSIEINGTYYGAQKPESFVKWRDETPDGFVFSVKAPRFVMNRNVLADAGSTIARFLGERGPGTKGEARADQLAVLAHQGFEPADFEAFLNLLPKEAGGRALRHAVEVRHESFRCADFISLVREHGVAVVIAADSPYPQIADATASFVYSRIMGTRGVGGSGYSDAALDLWAARARAWACGTVPEGLDVHRAAIVRMASLAMSTSM